MFHHSTDWEKDISHVFVWDSYNYKRKIEHPIGAPIDEQIRSFLKTPGTYHIEIGCKEHPLTHDNIYFDIYWNGDLYTEPGELPTPEKNILKMLVDWMDGLSEHRVKYCGLLEKQAASMRKEIREKLQPFYTLLPTKDKL